MNSKTPKIISGIVATMSLIALDFVLLPSFWFWVSLEFSAAVLVAYGCVGEWYLHHHPAGRKKVEKEAHHKQESRYILSVALGVTMELFLLGHSIREGIKLEDKVSEANKRTAKAELAIAALNKSTIELAHQYDLSTNALAEANSRLSAIRPLKDRIIQLLNEMDPKMLPALQSGKTSFEEQIPVHLHSRLASIAAEPGSGGYISSIKVDPTLIIVSGAGQVFKITLELSPALLK
jgi:hypothetical protein